MYASKSGTEENVIFHQFQFCKTEGGQLAEIRNETDLEDILDFVRLTGYEDRRLWLKNKVRGGSLFS
jgi:hypothetical protein